jgi:hypothetical protein
MNDNDDDNYVIIDDHHDHDILIFIIQSFIEVQANGYNCNWQTLKYTVNTKN